MVPKSRKEDIFKINPIPIAPNKKEMPLYLEHLPTLTESLQ